MAILVTPTNLQKLEFDVTTAEGPSRVTIVTGEMPIDGMLTSVSTGAAGSAQAAFKASRPHFGTGEVPQGDCNSGFWVNRIFRVCTTA
jgi:hypothetical protein